MAKMILNLKKSTHRGKDVDDCCPECLGDGTWECDTCDGDGEFFHDGHFYECKSCDGDGKTVCGECNGKGTREAYEEVREARHIDWLLKNRYGTTRPKSIRDYWMAS